PPKARFSTSRKHSPDPEEQDDLDQEHLEAMSPLLKPFDAKEWLQDQMRKTPWWAISIAFHALILACMGLITFSEHIFKAEAPRAAPRAASPARARASPTRWAWAAAAAARAGTAGASAAGATSSRAAAAARRRRARSSPASAGSRGTRARTAAGTATRSRSRA